MEDLNNTINQGYLADIYRGTPFINNRASILSSVYGTFSKTDNILGNNTHLNKFKRFVIIQNIFYDVVELN